MIPGSSSAQFFGAAGAASGAGGYEISRSLRFNSSDSAYLSRTPSTAGNRKTWTRSFWIKRVDADFTPVMAVNDGSTYNEVYFLGAANLESFLGASVRSTAVFRDFSAWYHIVEAVDTTQATASDRVKLYVNGVQQTSFLVANYPSQNADTLVNSTILHTIGNRDGQGLYIDAYLADIHFIDGQALDPTSFGEFDDNGIWQPIAYSGTYGTNGFHLDFADNSTAAALGTDTSGAGNNWTVNNISVAAGSGNDSLVDTPTNYGTDTGAGGEVRGNYATLNPLGSGTSQSLSNGNLDIVSTSTADNNTPSTIGMSSGKWYFEVTIVHIGNTTGGEYAIGLGKDLSPNTVIGNNATSWAYASSGEVRTNSSNSSYGASYTTGDVLGAAFDADAGTLVFYKNGVSQGNAATGIASGTYFFLTGTYVSSSARSVNFGQRPFAYTAPSGFKALCTTNLPDPVVAKPSEVMDVALYTGNGSTQTISGLGFSPDLVWGKGRSTPDLWHNVYDTIRGVQKVLFTNATNAEDTKTTGLTAFNSDGFTIGDNGNLNTLNEPMVAWCWDAGSSTVSNPDGSITSQVRTNGYLSIVTYTGTGATATVGHGLGVAPGFIIIKRRDGAVDWVNYHSALGPDKYLQLNLTSAAATSSGYWGTVNSSTFGLPSFSTPNASGGTYVAYCFAPVAGYSSFGSYEGSGSTQFVYTGFRPKFLIVKCSAGSSTQEWVIKDGVRNPYNAANFFLYANASDTEGSSDRDCDFLSNGFSIPGSIGPMNFAGRSYIYIAFAESPFQYARAR